MNHVYRERNESLRGSDVAGSNIARRCRAREGASQGEHGERSTKTETLHGRPEIHENSVIQGIT